MMGRFNIIAPLICALALALAYLVIQIAGPTGLGRVAKLESEIAELKLREDELGRRNDGIAEELRRLRADDRQFEALARYHFSMVKPGEVLILTDD